jgi:hypothetical protein
MAGDTQLKLPFDPDEKLQGEIDLGEEGERDWESGVASIAEITGLPVLQPEVELLLNEETTPTAVQITRTSPIKPSRFKTRRHRRNGPDDNFTGFHGPVSQNER